MNQSWRSIFDWRSSFYLICIFWFAIKQNQLSSQLVHKWKALPPRLFCTPLCSRMNWCHNVLILTLNQSQSETFRVRLNWFCSVSCSYCNSAVCVYWPQVDILTKLYKCCLLLCALPHQYFLYNKPAVKKNRLPRLSTTQSCMIAIMSMTCCLQWLPRLIVNKTLLCATWL